MRNLKASLKNGESCDSPQYLKIPNVLILQSSTKAKSNSSKPIQTAFRANISKESPFYKSIPSDTTLQTNRINIKSSYNVLKDNQEYKIGEDPKKRVKYMIKTKLPPLDVYNCLTNEIKTFQRPEVVKKEKSSYQDNYFSLYNQNYNAFHKKFGECELYLDKSKIMNVFGNPNQYQRGIPLKDFSILPSVNKSNSPEKNSFLSNSMLNSKIYSTIETINESRMKNISSRKEIERNYSFLSVQKQPRWGTSVKKRAFNSKDFILNNDKSTNLDKSNINILIQNNINLEISHIPYSQEKSKDPVVYSEENIDFYSGFEEKIRKQREKERERLKNLKIRLDVIRT